MTAKKNIERLHSIKKNEGRERERERKYKYREISYRIDLVETNKRKGSTVFVTMVEEKNILFTIVLWLMIIKYVGMFELTMLCGFHLTDILR